MRQTYPKIYLYKRVVQAKLFIDVHYSATINLRCIADEAHFSRFHFLRLFKSVYGRTPHQYLMAVRLEAARRLLESGSSVAAACFEVGFESVSSFTSGFRRFSGATPAAYQKAFFRRRAQVEAAPLQFIPACFAAKNGWS